MANEKDRKQRRGRHPSSQNNRDLRPSWWRNLARRLDVIGRLAERLEPRWQRWWVPVVLLSFPVLLLLLAFVVAALR